MRSILHMKSGYEKRIFLHHIKRKTIIYCYFFFNKEGEDGNKSVFLLQCMILFLQFIPDGERELDTFFTIPRLEDDLTVKVGSEWVGGGEME